MPFIRIFNKNKKRVLDRKERAQKCVPKMKSCTQFGKLNLTYQSDLIFKQTEISAI